MESLMRKHVVPLAMSLLCLAPTANAGYYQGKISNIFALGGKIVIGFSGGAGAGLCAGAAKFYLDPAAELDRVIISLAMAAKATDSVVWVQGDDGCIASWPYENAQHLIALNY